MRSSRRFALALACALFVPGAARAWKPYTHNYTGNQVYGDLNFDAGKVKLNDAWLDVDPRIAAAIKACKSCFIAGTVGPDGFPDLAYGQAVIHPVKTGEWMRRLVDKAWQVQSDPRYSDAERQQVLAWTYGFLTHAAGDVWGHTLVNEFALGVFPGVKDILKDPSEAAKAIRHILIEGVVGDATAGFDGNPDRTVAPGGYDQTSGDMSEDSTPGQRYDAPTRFIYEALVDKSFATPWKDKADGTYQPPKVPQRGEYVDARGILVGGFLELSDALGDFIADTSPDPLEAAINSYDDTLADLRALEDDCNFDGFWDSAHDLVACPWGLLQLGFDFVVESAEAFWNAVVAITEDLVFAVLDAYLNAWRDDIDRGLRHWGELGLASTRALFDAQTRRNLQNEECQWDGPETSLTRENCEKDVGLTAVLRNETNPFVWDYGLSMAGLPDFTGDVARILSEIGDTVDDILGALGVPFQPFKEAKAQISEWIEGLIEDAISEAIGIDVEQLKDFLKKPSSYVCLSQVQMTLPKLGLVTVPLFQYDEHERLDRYLGIAGTDHHDQVEGLPAGCGFLKDSVQLDPMAVSAVRDTIITAKLAMMTGPQIDGLLGGMLQREIRTYAAEHDNVLVKALGDRPPWLLLIDGDHSWRQDGEPIYPFPRVAPDMHAGTGYMPIWESCVLRPAFRTIFQDWENPYTGKLPAGHGPLPGTALQNFPFLKDSTSVDPLNDPAAPASQLVPSGTWLLDGSTYFVAASGRFSLYADEVDPLHGFQQADIGVRRAQYANPLVKTAELDWPIGEPFPIDGSDGPYYLDYHADDPCHPFETGEDRADGSAPEPIHTVAVTKDTTPPVTTCNAPPFGQTFDTAALSAVSYSIADAYVGVATSSATLDGVIDASGPVPVSSGSTLDMYLLAPGTRTVAVTAADRLGNGATTACTFTIVVTADSLRKNLDRAWAEGKIDGHGIYNALGSKLDAAAAAHVRGNHNAERNIVNAFENLLKAQRGKAIDRATADHLILYAQYFEQNGQ